jgi:DNA-directed RNA polymerase specialized sigma24 family protein
MISVECRQLWRLYLKHGLSYRQIGELWEKTEANVRRRMWACRKTAREIREKLLAEDKRMADSLAGKGKGTQD